jgi:hypothetical protein
LTKNLPNEDEANQREFDKRVKIADLMLKEADIKNKSKIVELQMSKTDQNMVDFEDQFLSNLTREFKNGQQ